MPEPRNPRVEDLERAAALHWQAPETEPLGEWRLRAAAGFTGRANSALPVGDPSSRRQGLGAAITSGLAAAAAGRGARRILLQVETGNAPARALYQRCGFRDSHRYQYMIAP